jgi:succinate dehydrogenase / fumarate reductase cytochrome b subunit
MMIYRWHLGYVAWLLNRVTGIAIAVYLAIHIWVIHHLTQGPEGFDKVMRFVQQPLFKLGEIGLLGVILYHAMNGLRILCIEWGTGYRVMAIGVVLFVFGALPIFTSALKGAQAVGEVAR